MVHGQTSRPTKTKISCSPGPSMMPVRSSMLSSFTTTRMPSGGSVRSWFNSRMSRRMTRGDTDWRRQFKLEKTVLCSVTHHISMLRGSDRKRGGGAASGGVVV